MNGLLMCDDVTYEKMRWQENCLSSKENIKSIINLII